MRAFFGLFAASVAAFGLSVSSAVGAPTDYIPMEDGTRLAANVTLPEGYDGGKLPTIFVYDGYAGGSSSAGERKGWATVHVSIRGTGCSGGQFALFDRRHAKDGREVMRWIAEQPWSNGAVGLMGHSYGGITAMLTASEPPLRNGPDPLKAVVASGLIDDLYRGIVYIGGVPNLGFPLLWTAAYRPAVDVSGGTAPGLAAGDQTCIENLADREVENPMDNPFLNGIVGYTDGPWWAEHSIYTRLANVNVPVFVGHAWQDEQTGPRGGPLVWEQLPKGLPKRFVASNGDHSVNGGSPPEVRSQRYAWLDRWVRGIKDRKQPRVQILLETADRDGVRSNGIIRGHRFPLRRTKWTRYYLRADGGLSTAKPGADGGSSTYVSGTSRQSWVYFVDTAGGEVTHAKGPDELTFTSEPFEGRPRTIAGPTAATLYARTTAAGVNTPTHTINTDFFVTVADEAPDGSLTYLQRGQLRASHRALDEHRTLYNGDGEIVRPEHPFTNPQGVTPGATERYEIEIFPVAHVFRPGHMMVVKIYSPPLWESLYAPTPSRFPSANTILHDAEHPSSLLVPRVRTPPLGDYEPACGELIGMRCIKPAG